MQKYIHIRHWNYWWEVYGCGVVLPAGPHAAEFSLTDDEAGMRCFSNGRKSWPWVKPTFLWEHCTIRTLLRIWLSVRSLWPQSAGCWI